MKILILTFAALTLITGHSDASKFNKTDQEKFMKYCLSEMKEKRSKKEKKEICQCTMAQMEKAFTPEQFTVAAEILKSGKPKKDFEGMKTMVGFSMLACYEPSKAQKKAAKKKVDNLNKDWEGKAIHIKILDKPEGEIRKKSCIEFSTKQRDCKILHMKPKYGYRGEMQIMPGIVGGCVTTLSRQNKRVQITCKDEAGKLCSGSSFDSTFNITQDDVISGNEKKLLDTGGLVTWEFQKKGFCTDGFVE